MKRNQSRISCCKLQIALFADEHAQNFDKKKKAKNKKISKKAIVWWHLLFFCSKYKMCVQYLFWCVDWSGIEKHFLYGCSLLNVKRGFLPSEESEHCCWHSLHVNLWHKEEKPVKLRLAGISCTVIAQHQVQIFTQSFFLYNLKIIQPWNHISMVAFIWAMQNFFNTNPLWGKKIHYWIILIIKIDTVSICLMVTPRLILPIHPLNTTVITMICLCEYLLKHRLKGLELPLDIQ